MPALSGLSGSSRIAKDLGKIRDEDLLSRIKAAIEEVEAAESLLDVNNLKKLISKDAEQGSIPDCGR